MKRFIKICKQTRARHREKHVGCNNADRHLLKKFYVKSKHQLTKIPNLLKFDK